MTQPTMIQQPPTAAEMVAQELQNRIGIITTQYEAQMAMLKAQATQEIQSRDKRIEELSRALANASSSQQTSGS